MANDALYTLLMDDVLDVVARYVGKHSTIYGYIRDDLAAQPRTDAAQQAPAEAQARGGGLCVERTGDPDFPQWDAVKRLIEPAPPSAPAPVAGDDVGLHVLTGVFDKHGEELRAGDRIVIRIEGEHTKPEYWNPEYVIAWAAPRFTLHHVGGGLDSDTARWYFGLGTDQGYKMLELLDRPAALAQDRASQPAAPSAPVGVIGDAIQHLSKWLDLNECECETSHQCGRAEVERTRDQLRALAQQPAAVDGAYTLDAIASAAVRAGISDNAYERLSIALAGQQEEEGNG